MKSISGRFLGLPRTQLGWWAAGLAVVFIALFILIPNSGMIFSGFLNMIFGFVAGILGLLTMLRQGERSWLVWLAVLCGLFVILFMLGEFMMPHLTGSPKTLATNYANACEFFFQIRENS